jgi:integrase
MNEERKEFEKWMIDRERFGPNTVETTLRKMEYVLRHTFSRDDTESMQAFIRETWEKKGNKTANGYIKIINRWLRFKGLDELKYFKEYGSDFQVQVSSPDEERKLLDVAKRRGPREYAMFSLMFGTGVRLGEAISLRVPDITIETITVRGKGQKVRQIYLPQATREAIIKYLEVRTAPSTKEDSAYLFTTKAGRRMSYDYFRRVCQEVSFAAGVKFHPHMARHTYATGLLKKGVSVLYVSKLLGHEDLESTAIYLHPSQADAIRAAREAIEKDSGQEEGYR